MSFIEFVNFISASATIFGDVVIAVLILVVLFDKNEVCCKLELLVGKHGLFLAFLVSLGALIGSLTYSEVIGYEPCTLCWIQRIFLFPQVIIFGIASFKKDFSIFIYSITLSALGAIVALYHSYIQLGGSFSLTPCTAFGGACTKVFVLEWGFVTIPMMAATAFLLMVILLVVAKRSYRNA